MTTPTPGSTHEPWWVIDEKALRRALQRARAGDDPEALLVELFANSDTEEVPGVSANWWNPAGYSPSGQVTAGNPPVGARADEKVTPVSVTDEVYAAARSVVDSWPESQDFPAMRRLRNAFVARDAVFTRMVEVVDLLAGNDEPEVPGG